MTREEAKAIYYKVIQKYKDNPGMLMGDIVDEFLSGYSKEAAEYLNGEIIRMMSAFLGERIDPNFKLSEFEIATNKLYEEFISSDSIETLSLSIKNLQSQIDHFKQHQTEESLVMSIKDFEGLNIELNALKYGLSHWIEIKKYIASSSNKQVDIQKGLSLNKQDLSTFFYMMDKLGFVKKETLKNRVYIKIIKDNKI